MDNSKFFITSILCMVLAFSVNGQQNVEWTSVVGSSVSGTTLSKTASNGWGNAGAESTNVLPSNTDGSIQYTVSTTTSGEFIYGLSDLNVDNNFYTVEYAFHRTNGTLSYVRLNGTSVSFFHVAVNDVLTMERSGTNIIFKKNSTTLYTANNVQQNSMIIDASLHSNAAQIVNLKASFTSGSADLITWINKTGVNQTNTLNLTKTAATGYGNAGASSANVLYYEQDGWVEFTLDAMTKDRAFGFSHANSDNNPNTIDFGFRTSGNDVFVYVNGTSQGNIPGAAIGDRFRVTRLWNTMYWQRNGFVVYVIDQTYRGGLIADVALGTNGANLYNAKCSFAVPATGEGIVPLTPEVIALTDLYNKMDGSHWERYYNWTQEIANWPPTSNWPINQSNVAGAHDNDGFVHYVYLIRSKVKGVIPGTFWLLRDLRSIGFPENQITGFENFDPSIAARNGVYEMDFTSNQIERLPDEFGSFGGLTNLIFDHNRLKSLPEFSAEMFSLHVYDNELTTLPSSILANENIKVRIDSNYLDFSILEQVYDQLVWEGVSLRQKKIRDVLEVATVEGSNLVIPARPPGNYSAIQWEKLSNGTWNSVLSQNEDESDETFTRDVTVAADSGYYRWKMTNSLVTGVTIESEPIHVKFKSRIEWAMENHGFEYRYDNRGRMIAKKVPGADWVYMVYDERDRLVMTQDGQQRLSNQWTYTRYDEINRPVMTGIYTHLEPIDQAEMTSLIDTASEEFDIAEVSNFGYTNNALALLDQENFSVLTVTYYDNYDFTELFDPQALEYRGDEFDDQFEYSETQGFFPFVRGLVTGSVTSILSKGAYSLPVNARFIHSVNYYDDNYRVVQSVSLNIHNTYDVTTNVFDFTGKVINAKARQSGLEEHVTTRELKYDHAGRLLKLWHKLDDMDAVLIAMNTYNGIGQLVEKGLHNTDEANALDNTREFRQSVDYNYNIRGWLTGINNASLSTSDPNAGTADLYGMELSYNTVDPNVGNSMAFNGNITAMKWSTFGDVSQRAYKYAYDPMNRLMSADQKIFNGGWYDSPDFAERDFGYDLNGNITTLTRMGGNEDYMDSLTYDYGPQGLGTNQLQSVTDFYSPEKGFLDGNTEGPDYAYDRNGNMTLDKNKGISSITYNYLNLPEKVEKGEVYVRYVYDATGRKWQQLVIQTAGDETEDDDIIVKMTDYLGEYVYENGHTRLANHEEGRIVFSNDEEIYHNGGNDVESLVAVDVTIAVNDYGNGPFLFVQPVESGGIAGIDEIGGTFEVLAGESYTIRLKGENGGAQLLMKVTIAGNTSYIPIDLYVNGTLGWNEYSIRITDTGSMTLGVIWETATEGDDWMNVYGFALQKDKVLAEPEYQYNLKDHLGNVRLTFTSKDETDESVATMESLNGDEEFTQFLNYDKTRRINHVVYDHTYDGQTPPDGTAYAVRLNGSANERIGLAKSLSVMPGDVLKIEVFAKYYEAPGGSNLGAFATLMASIIGGTQPSGTFMDKLGYPTNNSTFVPFDELVGKSEETGTRPKAYLNWLIFDRDYHVIGSQSSYARISTAAKEDTTNILHERLAPPSDIVIREAGYAYIWLSNENESPVEVYFDDFKIEHIKSPVVESQSFYPFGLTFNSYSRENSLSNRWKFQGQEHVDDLGLNWDSFKWRNHQPELGRFFNVDPLADRYVYNSPYAFAENQVTAFVELEGMEKGGRGGSARYQTQAAQNYRSMVRRDIVRTTYEHNDRELKPGVREPVNMTPPKEAKAAGLMLELQDSWNDMAKVKTANLKLRITKNETQETNVFGDTKTEGVGFSVSGEGANEFHAMQKSYTDKTNAMFDEQFSAYATQTLGKDFNSLSADEQSKFRVENLGAAGMIRFGVEKQMGPSPMLQVLNLIGQMIQQGGVKEEKRKDRQPMVGPR